MEIEDLQVKLLDVLRVKADLTVEMNTTLKAYIAVLTKEKELEKQVKDILDKLESIMYHEKKYDTK